jgi:outer membrane protein OmpA-like peptidoglycan-associated protein
VLDSAAQVMASHPELRIEVHGHTDSAGPVDVNLDLSRRRAERVVAYLVERGVAASRLSAVGHGAGKPRYDNSTRVGRAANRRVELVRPQGSSSQEAPAPAPVTKDSASEPGG